MCGVLSVTQSFTKSKTLGLIIFALFVENQNQVFLPLRQQEDDPSNQIILKNAAKQGVTAESNDVSQKSDEKTRQKIFPKTDAEKRFIRSALSANLFLKALSLRQLDLLADYMQQEYFTENKAIINEGELGTCMYVLADGQLEVRKDHRILKVIKSGEEWVD